MSELADLEAIYQKYTPGSQGFCIAVETHCSGYNMSRTEIERVAKRAPTAVEFDRIWDNEFDWGDPPCDN